MRKERKERVIERERERERERDMERKRQRQREGDREIAWWLGYYSQVGANVYKVYL